MFALTLRMLLIGISVKVPAGAAGAAAACAGAAGAAAGVVAACQWKRFIWRQINYNKTFRHIMYDTQDSETTQSTAKTL